MVRLRKKKLVTGFFLRMCEENYLILRYSNFVPKNTVILHKTVDIS